MVPLAFDALPPDVTLSRGHAFHAEMNRRRTTRHFSNAPVPREAIECAIRVAGTAPSGAHQQPWTFVAISDMAVLPTPGSPIKIGLFFLRRLSI